MTETQNRKQVELLAPAGDMVCLHAAVRAGAQAVYLGAEGFNARRGAGNFTLDELADACSYAHLRNVRIYLTVNTVILPSEVKRALELVRQAYRRGVDAFIIQDIGFAAEVHRILPEAEIHISTQMNVHNEAGVRASAVLGAKRVTFARELSLDEIARLTSVAHELCMETEAFAHGALCICYSGQCLMSSLVGGRSANRGMCAQACRLPYELHNKAVNKTLPADGEHLLSPKDLCSIDLIPDLIISGVDSLKIEGRMKSPEYVYSVVSVYRAVIDRVEAAMAAGQPVSPVTDEEHRRLAEAFSRGFTTAYLTGETGNDMMSYSQPNNRGVFMGRVQKCEGGLVTIQSEHELNEGDLLGIWTNRGHFTHTVSGLENLGKGRYRFCISKRTGKGDRVFRMRDASAAFVDDAQEPRIPVTGTVELRVGIPMAMSFVAPNGAFSRVEGPIVEAARTRSVSPQDVLDHVDRMGTTPFCLADAADLEISLDEGVGVGFSQLHRLRADALAELEEQMLLMTSGMRDLPKSPEITDEPVFVKTPARIAVTATNPACARAAKRAGADIIYIPAVNEKRGEAVVAGQRSTTVEQAGYPNRTVTMLPVVNHDEVPGSREETFDFDAWEWVRQEKSVCVENFGQLIEAVERGAVPEVGSHVPITNPLSLHVAAKLGASRVWLSPELALGQIADILEDKPLSAGLTVIGQAELMVTEHCLLMSQGPCNKDCSKCVRRKSPHYLKDRKGYEMPVITDRCGRSHLYNAVQLDLTHLMPDLLRAGVDSFMIDTTLMNVEETTKAVQRVRRALDVAQKQGQPLQKTQGTTTGHIFRGVE